MINPLIVEGLVHGGVVQGIAEGALGGGVPTTRTARGDGVLADYQVPSAADPPTFVTDRRSSPSRTNPGGSKGVGEAGTIASPPAVVNAVIDALSPLGVNDIGMPLHPRAGLAGHQSSRRRAPGRIGEGRRPVLTSTARQPSYPEQRRRCPVIPASFDYVALTTQ